MFGVVTWTLDVASGRIQVSAGAESLLALPSKCLAELRLNSVADLVHPGDRPRFAAGLKTAQRSGRFEESLRFVGADGAIRRMLCRGVVVRGERSRPLELAGVGIDLTSLPSAGSECEASAPALEDLTHQTFQSLPPHLAVLDASGRILAVNRAWLSFAERNGAPCADRVAAGASYLEVCRTATRDGEPDAARALAGIESVLSRQASEFTMDYPCDAPDEPRWFSMTVVPLDPERRNGAVVMHFDLTARHQAEERQRLLTREMSHRSKNMLSLVQVMVEQTARKSLRDFVERFDERARSLAAAQDLLIANAFSSVPLDALVRSQLSHFADLMGSRILVGGPAVLLSAQAAQTLGMALHELATNAAKYGALSSEAGQVLVDWQTLSSGPDATRFRLRWRESGGPAIGKPQRTGFGTSVLTEVIERSFEATVTLQYPPSGVQWLMTCDPLNVLQSD